MKTKILRTDFTFTITGYGLYRVTYTSPYTGKRWTKITDNMPLVDATKNADDPKKVDLDRLKRFCKS